MHLARLFIFTILATASVCASAKVHHVVIDLALGGRAPLANTIETVKNVRKAFAPESIEVEVVCHGSGLDLVVAKGNDFVDRIKAMQRQGVVFAACANTMKSRHVSRGQLIPGTQVVDAGTAELIRKQEAGWPYIKLD
jgi:hypothetical protein